MCSNQYIYIYIYNNCNIINNFVGHISQKISQSYLRFKYNAWLNRASAITGSAPCSWAMDKPLRRLIYVYIYIYRNYGHYDPLCYPIISYLYRWNMIEYCATCFKIVPTSGKLQLRLRDEPWRTPQSVPDSFGRSGNSLYRSFPQMVPSDYLT